MARGQRSESLPTQVRMRATGRADSCRSATLTLLSSSGWLVLARDPPPHLQPLSSRIWILPWPPKHSLGHARLRRLSTRHAAMFRSPPSRPVAERFPA